MVKQYMAAHMDAIIEKMEQRKFNELKKNHHCHRYIRALGSKGV